MNESNTYQSALFITIARDAEARCKGIWTEHAVTSVVMAYLALEAFVNEVASVSTMLAKQDEKIALWKQVTSGSGAAKLTSDEFTRLSKYVAGWHRDIDPPSTRALSVALDGKDRKPTLGRYDLVLETLGAPAGFKQTKPYLALSHLRLVRNYLVHCRSEDTVIEMEGGGPIPGGWDLGMVVERNPVPTFAEYLTDAGLVPKGTFPGPLPTPFINLLCRREIAAWACDVVARAVREVDLLLPKGELKKELNSQSLLGSRSLDGSVATTFGHGTQSVD